MGFERKAVGPEVVEGKGCNFRVWAPKAEKVSLKITHPQKSLIEMKQEENGYFTCFVDDIKPGARYFYRLNELDRPDPASRFQPEGVHGPSEVIHLPKPTDLGWKNIPLHEYVIYELHVGTFSTGGTFESAIPHLARLCELGFTAIEIMPVAQFPGAKNWGYDGVFPFAVQSSYGGPTGLQRLVEACHKLGLAVILDVVYNHLGPEGNYFGDFGHYFNSEYSTPWGAAINFDNAHSDEVRSYFIQNAIYWKDTFGFDALRLDAIHAIRDFSAAPFLKELKEALSVQPQLPNPFYLIAESDSNDPRVISSPLKGGMGLDAQWDDDFHHCVHHLLTGERNGYYNDYTDQRYLPKVFREAFVYTGGYSQARKRRHGAPVTDASPQQFVVCTQNHDQIGNRLKGERLTALVGVDELKLAAMVLILSPFTPLVFMGEEYGEPAPFQYFADHSEKALIKAVKEGRKKEFAAFKYADEPPDPFDDKTFKACKLNHALASSGPNLLIAEFYKKLLKARRDFLLAHGPCDWPKVTEFGAAIVLHYQQKKCLLVLNFGKQTSRMLLPDGSWSLTISSKGETGNVVSGEFALDAVAGSFFVAKD